MKNIMMLFLLLLTFLYSCEEPQIVGRGKDCSFDKCEEGFVCNNNKCTDIAIYVPDSDLKACLIYLIKAENTYKHDEKEFYDNLTEVYQYDVKNFVVLNCKEKDYPNISSLEGLQYLKKLIDLELSMKTVTNLNPLKETTKLRDLRIHSGYELTDISALENLTELEIIIFKNTEKLEDISPLRNLVNLYALEFSKASKLKDIGIITYLTNLKSLTIYNSNLLTNISAIRNLINLERLSISYSPNLSDISAVSNLKKLTYLDFDNNKIKDVSPLKDLSKLSYASLHYNYIEDVSSLTNFVDVEFLRLSYNCISDSSPLNYLLEDETRIIEVELQQLEVCRNNITWEEWLESRN